MKKILLLTLLLLTLTGCVNIRRSDQAFLKQIESKQLPITQVKDPNAAAWLNILPGFGNFYLAIGTNHTEQWPVGIVNLLLWPLSIIWGVPQAAIDASTINKLEAINHYRYDPDGIKAFR